MWIICLADDSHEMSKLIFLEIKKKYLKMVHAAGVIGFLIVNKDYVGVQAGHCSLQYPRLAPISND